MEPFGIQPLQLGRNMNQGMSMNQPLAFGQNTDMYGRSLDPQMSYGQTFDSNGMGAGTQAGAFGATDGGFSFGDIGMDQIGAGVGIGKDLFSMYAANQGMNLAKDQLQANQAAFDYNKGIRDENRAGNIQAFANQKYSAY